MNLDKMRELELRLRNLKHEEEYDQETWAEKKSCGTAACVAGHAVLMEGLEVLFGDSMYLPSFLGESVLVPAPTPDQEARKVSIRQAAKEILDLDRDETDMLFTPEPTSHWPREFAQRWRLTTTDASNDERRSIIAADLIAAMIRGEA